MTDDGLREVLAAALATDWGPATGKTLREAVLDVLVPAARAWARGQISAVHRSDGDPRHPTCLGCRDECLYCEADHEWPCPTFLALAADDRTEPGDVRAAVLGSPPC